MNFLNKRHLIEPVIIREPIGGFYCCKGLISEVLDSSYATISINGYSTYTFHRDELLPREVIDESLTPSDYSFKTIMTAMKCGTMKPLPWSWK